MRESTGVWQDWLTDEELAEWQTLQEDLDELKNRLFLIQAKRDAIRRRAMNRRYVVNTRG